jgi:DNA-binding transcriptional LysR family regulator
VAQEALDRKGIAWRIVCTCGSLSGLVAAAQAGMGVLVQPRSMTPAALREITQGSLPALEDVEFVLVPRKGASPELVEALAARVVAKVAIPPHTP